MTNAQEQVLYKKPLARYNTWRVGGVADTLYCPQSLKQLSAFLANWPKNTPITWLGLGSNVLIRDGGIAGLVVLTHPGLTAFKRLNDTTVMVEAGMSCAKLARFCARNGLAGGTFFAGIPGTLGGALAMNAGAFGGETWPLVRQVETIDAGGVIHQYDQSEFVTGYRHVVMPQEGQWFVRATLAFAQQGEACSMEAIKALLKKRKASQPIGLPSCGSVFRNPPGDYAARLIEACGLKGYHINGARVSLQHGNFIVHDGSASANDIERLIEYIKATVKAREGVELQTEVRILGRQGGSGL